MLPALKDVELCPALKDGELLSLWGDSVRMETFCLSCNYSPFAQLSTRTAGLPSEGVFSLDVFSLDGVHSGWS